MNHTESEKNIALLANYCLCQSESLELPCKASPLHISDPVSKAQLSHNIMCITIYIVLQIFTSHSCFLTHKNQIICDFTLKLVIKYLQNLEWDQLDVLIQKWLVKNELFVKLTLKRISKTQTDKVAIQWKTSERHTKFSKTYLLF